MAQEKSGVSKRITFEDGRIIIESNNKEWLDFIKNEILTQELPAKSSSDPAINPGELAKKFVDRCWRSIGMSEVLRTIVYAEGKITRFDLAKSYATQMKKTTGLAGVVSGMMRNAKKIGLPKGWLIVEHNASGATYSIDTVFKKLLKKEVVLREVNG